MVAGTVPGGDGRGDLGAQRRFVDGPLRCHRGIRGCRRGELGRRVPFLRRDGGVTVPVVVPQRGAVGPDDLSGRGRFVQVVQRLLVLRLFVGRHRPGGELRGVQYLTADFPQHLARGERRDRPARHDVGQQGELGQLAEVLHAQVATGGEGELIGGLGDGLEYRKAEEGARGLEHEPGLGHQCELNVGIHNGLPSGEGRTPAGRDALRSMT